MTRICMYSLISTIILVLKFIQSLRIKLTFNNLHKCMKYILCLYIFIVLYIVYYIIYLPSYFLLCHSTKTAYFIHYSYLTHVQFKSTVKVSQGKTFYILLYIMYIASLIYLLLIFFYLSFLFPAFVSKFPQCEISKV